MAASQPRLVGGRCPVILRQASTTGVADEADEDQPIDGDPRRGRLLSVAELRRALQLTREGLAAPTRLAPSPREPRTFQGGPGLPLRVVDDDAAAGWVVGASGGSGESLLAELLNGDGGDRYAAAGHHWPAAAAGGPIRVVLCGRTDMRSLTDVQLALAQWGTGRLPAVNLVGMVLMADAPGRAPRPIQEFIQVLAGGSPRLWRIPWIGQWRLGPPPNSAAVPKPVQTVLADVRSAITDHH